MLIQNIGSSVKVQINNIFWKYFKSISFRSSSCQPVIQGAAAEWDDDWDMLEDEGIAPPEPKSPSEGSTPTKAESVLSDDTSCDDPRWGAFESHYDTDSVSDFNSSTSQDMEYEDLILSSFFESKNWSLNPPIKTESTGPDIFENVFADSVPSTPSYNYGNSPSREFDSFSRYNSFSLHGSGLFPPLEALTRSDSMSSTSDSECKQEFFSPTNSPTRSDSSTRSTGDDDFVNEFSAFDDSDSFRSTLTRFDSTRSTNDSGFGHDGFSVSGRRHQQRQLEGLLVCLQGS